MSADNNLLPTNRIRLARSDIALYGMAHDWLVRFLRRSRIPPSTLCGPPKGTIRDIKQWTYSTVAADGDTIDKYYRVVQQATSYELPSPQSISLRSTDLFRNEQKGEFPEHFVATIPRARVIMRTGMVISPDDRLFEQSCSWGGRFFPSDIEYNSLRRLLRPTMLSGTYLTIFSRARENYYHWISECLTRLCTAGPMSSTSLLVPSDLNSWQRESLALFGFDEVRLHPVEESCIEVDHLCFPSFAGTTGCMSKWAFCKLRQKMSGDRTPLPGKRLYVSRSGVAHRRVVNEDATIRALEREGFVAVDCSRLSFAEQVSLFADAEVIVGAHGAGLTNLVFAPAGAAAIEILDPEHLVGCYYQLAACVGQQYWYIVGNNQSVRHGHAVRKGYDDITIPVDELLRTVDAATYDCDVVAPVSETPS